VIAKGIMPDYLEPRAIILLRVVGAAIIFWIVGIFLLKKKLTEKIYLNLDLFPFLE